MLRCGCYPRGNSHYRRCARSGSGLGWSWELPPSLAAVPAYLFLAPPSVWEPESLLVALLVLSFVSYGAAVEVRGAATLDASFIASLVAVVFLGPLPAACIFALPEINGWFERGRVVSLLGNTASAFWGALAGGLDARGAVVRRAARPGARRPTGHCHRRRGAAGRRLSGERG